MTTALRRMWLPVLIVAAVAVGGVAVTQFRSVFGSNPVVVTQKSSDSAADFNPKVVTYEVFGSAATAVINYLDSSVMIVLEGQETLGADAHHFYDQIVQE